MKKLLLLAIAGVLLASCSKDKDEPETRNETETGNENETGDENETTAPSYYVIDFENVADSYLAVDAAGSNLNPAYGDNRYFGYKDPASGLTMNINVSPWSNEVDFYGGGIAISQWNDTVTEGFQNQCSAYFKDAKTGKGGYNGSATFAVVYVSSGVASEIAFEDDTKEVVFDHFYVNNTTYGYLAMKNGYYDARAHTVEKQDYLKLIAEGFDKSDVSTGKVEFYLSDFRTAASPGIVEEWTKIDLSSLGAVHKIVFDMEGSDVGDWGLNTPAYFCFDNLAIRQ